MSLNILPNIRVVLFAAFSNSWLHGILYFQKGNPRTGVLAQAALSPLEPWTAFVGESPDPFLKIAGLTDAADSLGFGIQL